MSDRPRSEARDRVGRRTRAVQARLRVEPRAKRHAPGGPDQPLEHVVVAPALHVQPGAGGAHLALVVEDALRDHRRDSVEIGVIENDGRRLAAQLHRDTRERPAAVLATSRPTSVDPVNDTFAISDGPPARSRLTLRR